jgi:hypothetical protein
MSASAMRKALPSSELPPAGCDPRVLEPWPISKGIVRALFHMSSQVRRPQVPDDDCTPIAFNQPVALLASLAHDPSARAYALILSIVEEVETKGEQGSVFETKGKLGSVLAGMAGLPRAPSLPEFLQACEGVPTGALPPIPPLRLAHQFGRLIVESHAANLSLIVDPLQVYRAPGDASGAPLVLVRFHVDERASMRTDPAFLDKLVRNLSARSEVSFKSIESEAVIRLVHHVLERTHARLSVEYVRECTAADLTDVSPDGWKLGALWPMSLVSTAAAAADRHKCGYCGTEGAKMLCKRCLSTAYCAVACQRSHWRAHKRACRSAEEEIARTPSVLVDLDEACDTAACARRAEQLRLGRDERVWLLAQLSEQRADGVRADGRSDVYKLQAPVSGEGQAEPCATDDVFLYNQRRSVELHLNFLNCPGGAPPPWVALWKYVMRASPPGKCKAFVRGALDPENPRALRLFLPETPLPWEQW